MRRFVCGISFIGWSALLFGAGAGLARQESAATKEKQRLEAQTAAVEKAVRAGQEHRPKVLILGMFHFQDAGLDDYKPKAVFDPLSESGQKQVTEVLERLEKFAPTKVAVEYPADKQEKLDESFRKFMDGTAKPSRNEITQLGYALAKRLKHERVYAFDAPPNPAIPSVDSEAAAKRLRLEELIDRKASKRYFDGIEIVDKLKNELPLRQVLLVMNDPKLVRLLHGAYFTGTFKVGNGEEYPGADAFITRWYNRNLRMFANAQRIASSPEDRVLFIVGAGHLGILRHCAECCSEIELVEVPTYLAPQ
jgi:hypothetical protein